MPGCTPGMAGPGPGAIPGIEGLVMFSGWFANGAIAGIGLTDIAGATAGPMGGTGTGSTSAPQPYP